MAIEKKHLLAFNRGVVSKIGLSRIDLERLGMSAEQQVNWVPRVLGSMQCRPGLEFIDFCREDLNLTRQLPFVFGVDDTALLEVGDDAFMRIRIDDVLISRPTVSTTILNPLFTLNLNDWTDTSAGASQVTWNAAQALFESDGDDRAILTTAVAVTVAGPDQSVEHALDIDCDKHIRVKVGTTQNGNEYFQADLGRGEHHLSFTPTGNFWIELSTDRDYDVRVNKCDLDASGTLEMIHPWASEEKLKALRWTQSGDVIYLASLTNDVISTAARKLVRYGARSWAIMAYEPEDGPFRLQNTESTTLTPSATFGDVTLTASEPLFDSDHATFPGALFYVDSNGQTVQNAAMNSLNDVTDVIRVAGVGQTGREFAISITGTFVATITLQFSTSESGPWTDVTSFTVPTSTTYFDEQDNAIIFYRLEVTAYTSGTAVGTLTYSSGTIRGVCRITAVASDISATVRVLKRFGNTDASKDWAEGEWSTLRGHPSTVKIHEGRLWWAGQDKFWGSISDAYEEFDPAFVGDAGAISRTIGIGPIKKVNWLMSLKRLFMGTTDMSAALDSATIEGNHPLGVQSNREDNPITPFNVNVKRVAARGIYVDRTEQRLYELAFDASALEYEPIDLTLFAPDFNEVGITQIAIQHKPDIRVHCVRSDGTVGMLVYDRAENVIAWVDIDANPNGELNGTGTGFQHCVEDVAVLPGTVEDQVYYTVKRSNGAVSGPNQGEERHLEKWALESEAVGGNVNKMADSFTHYSGAPISTLTGLNHLAGLTCTVWADGANQGTVAVGTTGTFDADLSGFADAPFSEIVIGLQYRARFKGTKLASQTGSAERGTSGIGLHDRKKVNRIGLVLRNSHYQGLQYGPTFDLLSDMPSVEEGLVTPADTIWTDYDQDNFAFGGDWSPDSRVCLECIAPLPCTVLSTVIHMETLEFD